MAAAIDVTVMTWIVAVLGLLIIGLLGALQLVAVVRPRSEWTQEHVYASTPERTDPVAYFAFNRGLAWADVCFWLPLQVGGSIGMLLGERWGFLLALAAAVPFVYSAILLLIWDGDMEFRDGSLASWIVWGIFPTYGFLEGIYAFVRLTG